MFPPFDTEWAYEECVHMAQNLDDGFMILERTARESKERQGVGVMLGCLICRDQSGNIIKLKTTSGISNRLSLIEGITDPDSIYVDPIVDPSLIEQALCKNDKEIHLLTDQINNLKALGKRDKKLESKRTELCNQSLDNVYNLYSFTCFDGVKRSLKEICAVTNKGKLPPTGIGECVEPKLLDYAFAYNLRPVSMAEIFYKDNRGTGQELISHTDMPVVNPCDERCGLLLPVMLGLDIVYRDQDIVIVNKQSGLLSVPGRGPEKADCIESRARLLFGIPIVQCAVHRLDMETSGLLIIARNKEAHRNLQQQFEQGLVQKNYIALLDGVLARKGVQPEGQMELYFRLDVDNRPHQIWDDVYGKRAITQWKVLDVERYNSPDGTVHNVTRVLFVPHTGRTHQLRLASADTHGFGVPIIGDSLYGICLPNERLMLHSSYISFTHPSTGKKMEFNLPPSF